MIRIASMTASVVALAVTIASLSPAAASDQTVPGVSPQRSPLQVASTQGKEVRVTSMNGAKRKGRLVSLSTSEVVFSEHGQPVSMALWEVQKVETVHHTARNAAIVSGVGGFIVGWKSCGEYILQADCWETGGAVYLGALGAALGALIGALINRAAADEHVVYTSSTPSVHVVPTITPTRAGVSLAMRW